MRVVPIVMIPLLAGCATKPIYVTPTDFHPDPFKRGAFKRALECRYAQDEHRQERRALRYQLSMSKTNYPPFK